jgi:hypothetical protein
LVKQERHFLRDSASTPQHKCQGTASAVPLKAQKNNSLPPAGLARSEAERAKTIFPPDSRFSR